MAELSMAARLWMARAVVGAGLLAAGQAEAGTLTYETIALSGQLAPGTATAFEAFNVPVIGGDGNVAFRAQVAGASTASGIWKHEAGALGAVALVGAQAAGASDGVYAGLLDPVVNAAGDVMVRGSISTGLLQSNIAIWREDGGSLALVARASQALPGAPGLQFNSTINPAFSHSGAIAFQGTVNGLPSIVAEGPGGFRLLAQTGAPVPGLSGHVFGPAPGGPMINAAGDTAFFASSGPAGGPRTTAVWLDSGGALTELARSGQTVAGFGVLNGFSGSPQINADGDVAFLASNTLGRPALRLRSRAGR